MSENEGNESPKKKLRTSNTQGKYREDALRHTPPPPAVTRYRNVLSSTSTVLSQNFFSSSSNTEPLTSYGQWIKITDTWNTSSSSETAQNRKKAFENGLFLISIIYHTDSHHYTFSVTVPEGLRNTFSRALDSAAIQEDETPITAYPTVNHSNSLCIQGSIEDITSRLNAVFTAVEQSRSAKILSNMRKEIRESLEENLLASTEDVFLEIDDSDDHSSIASNKNLTR